MKTKQKHSNIIDVTVPDQFVHCELSILYNLVTSTGRVK